MGNDARPLPTPTAKLPGTIGKLAVLMRRARRRQQLFHPDDARLHEAVVIDWADALRKPAERRRDSGVQPAAVRRMVRGVA